MALIYLDTNVYVEFYRSANDRLSTFLEIEKYASSIVVTRQTADEFFRNRFSTLARHIETCKGKVAGSLIPNALLLEMDEYRQILEHQQDIRKLAEKLLTRLSFYAESGIDDPLMTAFEGIKKNAYFYDTTPDILQSARDRKDLGNPPRSKDKQTIGDEVIWETLLASVKDDLILVTSDENFWENIWFLKAEYAKVTGRKLLFITKKINEALEAVNVRSEILEEAETDVAAQKEYERIGARINQIVDFEIRAREIDPTIGFFGANSQYRGRQIRNSLARYRHRLQDAGGLTEGERELVGTVDEILRTGTIPSDADHILHVMRDMRQLVEAKNLE